jgi:hypothetical protein
VHRLRPRPAIASLCLGGALLGVLISAPVAHLETTATARNPLFAVLSGGNVVGKPRPLPVGPESHPTVLAGAADGWGSATLIVPRPNTICFSVLAAGIDRPTTARIHRGRAGTNGPIVATLDAPNHGDPGSASGCRALDERTLDAIRREPSAYYLEVRTLTFQEGAMRGQLF